MASSEDDSDEFFDALEHPLSPDALCVHPPSLPPPIICMCDAWHVSQIARTAHISKALSLPRPSHSYAAVLPPVPFDHALIIISCVCSVILADPAAKVLVMRGLLFPFNAFASASTHHCSVLSRRGCKGMIVASCLFSRTSLALILLISGHHTRARTRSHSRSLHCSLPWHHHSRHPSSLLDLSAVCHTDHRRPR